MSLPREHTSFWLYVFSCPRRLARARSFSATAYERYERRQRSSALPETYSPPKLVEHGPIIIQADGLKRGNP